MIADMSNKHHNKAPCAFEIILSMLLYFGFQKITKILLKTNQSMICNWDRSLVMFCVMILSPSISCPKKDTAKSQALAPLVYKHCPAFTDCL